MQSIFTYSPTNKMHGILRYFLGKGDQFYSENLEYHGTSYCFDRNTNRTLLPKYAFDFVFDDEYYWYGDGYQEGLANLTFCLPNYYLRLNGFELLSTAGQARAKTFAFLSSIENHTYSHYIVFSGDYSSIIDHYFEYHSPIAKCFRLTCLNSTLGTKVFDVVGIEIYGELHSSISEFFHPTCKQLNIHQFCLFFTLLLI